jgi:hypothetical protein
LLQFGTFVWDDRIFDWTHLQTNAAVYAGIEVNPKPISTFDIFARAGMNASNWTSADAISNSFADICNDSVRHVSILDFRFGIWDWKLYHVFLTTTIQLVHSEEFSFRVFCGLKSSLRTWLEFYSFGFLRTEVLTTNRFYCW